ncbi:MAG: hypothetical protein H6706_23525 [Myxococcales bacterium]|nr:hypothetical protein [Myxococcales bacterium]
MSALARRVQETDYFRRSPAHLGGPGGHKEWQHFLVHAPGLELLINFSLGDEHRLDGRPGQEVGRVIVVVRTAEGHRGVVERTVAADLQVRGGQVDARFGPSGLRFADGAWLVDVALPGLSARLRVRPETWPAVSSNIPLGPGRQLSWLIVPRAMADGEVVVDGRRHRVAGALAYHDHNWGHFQWGDDFAWEWGQAVPADAACPWSVVFVRMADRRRTRVATQGLFLWRGPDQRRVFRDRDLAVEAGPPLALAGAYKLPPVMALLAPEESGDVPAWLEATAEADGDHLRLRFEATHVAQILIPDEADPLGVTRLNEVSGPVTLTGAVGGEAVALAGPAVFEFVRG